MAWTTVSIAVSAPTTSVVRGRASVCEGSLIASPTRVRPTSIARIRMSGCYNSPIPHKFASAAVALALACCTVGAQEAEHDRAEALARRAAERLQTLHEEADRLAAEERSVLGDLRRLELEREIRSEEFRQADAAAATIARDLAAIDGQIGDLEAQDAVAKPALRARLLSLYKVGQGRYARMLLSISDLR